MNHFWINRFVSIYEYINSIFRTTEFLGACWSRAMLGIFFALKAAKAFVVK